MSELTLVMHMSFPNIIDLFIYHYYLGIGLPTPKESLRVLRSINGPATTQHLTQEIDTSFLPLQTTVIITECATMTGRKTRAL